MILFSEEKPMVFKIVNGILLLWLIGSLVVGLSTVVNLTILKEPQREITLEIYTREYCFVEGTEKPSTEQCKEDWEADKEMLEDDNTQFEKQALASSIISFVVVGLTLTLLNVSKKSTNKKK